MTATVVIGSQWGDEGKGKIIDFLGQSADVTVRYSGGDNAGHSLVVNDQKLALRLIPSGILAPNSICIIGNGTVINPATLLDEIKELNGVGVNIDHLKISDRAHIVFPYHILQDQQQERDRSKNGEKIGTTNKGIGPAYMDKMQRIGIRAIDLLDNETLEEKIAFNLEQKKRILDEDLWNQLPSLKELTAQYIEYGEILKDYITDTSYLIHTNLNDNKRVLFEGAQGTMLDIDHGTYPFVTSSNPTAGGAATGAGIGVTKIKHVIGVCKSYVSRVGEGPFPTEQINEVGDRIREIAHEYGTVTKRPRRIGWFDGVLMKYVSEVNGLTDLVVNCLDVLSGFKELKICTGYQTDHGVIKYYPASEKELKNSTPIYETLPGWDEDLTQMTTYEELPANAKNYLKKIEEITGVPVSAFSIGPDREQTIVLNDMWSD
ncbi:adenylosuccinate synthase [Pediococcus pentosaceus]|uniref:adenylosuccinate synthase n=1 Tax=Pediococcus pentosaceus TaxID=1255 RepID=UPI00398B80FE